ncbi:MAG: hypothetical protein FWF81_11580 [Defluviitaleaceae bacterium]|nr:hypothetical protein [Defluviitaleaceae bacterium]
MNPAMKTDSKAPCGWSVDTDSLRKLVIRSQRLPDFSSNKEIILIGLESEGYTQEDVTILIPEGEVDCKSFLDYAMDTIGEDGGIIRLLPGEYQYSSPWVISKPHVTIQGFGHESVLNMNGVRSNTLNITNSRNRNSILFIEADDVSVIDLALISPSGVRAEGITFGGTADTVEKALIDGCLIAPVGGSAAGSTSRGIHVWTPANGVIIRNCHIANTGDVSGNFTHFGIAVTGRFWHVHDNLVEPRALSGSSSSTEGIRLHNCSDCIIEYNNIRVRSSGTLSAMLISGVCNRNIIRNNILRAERSSMTRTNARAFLIQSINGSGNQITHNDLTDIVRRGGGSWVVDNISHDLPGSPTGIVSLWENGIIGFNHTSV